MEEGVQWTKNLRGIPPFTHALLNEHLITDDSSKLGKPPNAHKHKKHGYQLFKDKMVTQVVAKANVLKDTEKFSCLKMLCMSTYTRTLLKYLVQVALVRQEQVVAVNM